MSNFHFFVDKVWPKSSRLLSGDWWRPPTLATIASLESKKSNDRGYEDLEIVSIIQASIQAHHDAPG
ncbi:kinesin family protein [Moniliophthora roreri]|nr:kinesin family protein [Moniliophthora roreri]